MSFEAAAWAIKQSPETQTDKLVLIALCDCFNKHNSRCDPSNTFLAKAAMCSERYVSESLSRLERDGYISITRRPGRRNNYEILTPELSSGGQIVTPELSSGVQPLTPELSSETPELSSDKPVITNTTTTRADEDFRPDTDLDLVIKRLGLKYNENDLLEYNKVYLADKIAKGHTVNPRNSFLKWLKVEDAKRKKFADYNPEPEKRRPIESKGAELCDKCRSHFGSRIHQEECLGVTA